MHFICNLTEKLESINTSELINIAKHLHYCKALTTESPSVSIKYVNKTFLNTVYYVERSLYKFLYVNCCYRNSSYSVCVRIYVCIIIVNKIKILQYITIGTNALQYINCSCYIWNCFLNRAVIWKKMHP